VGVKVLHLLLRKVLEPQEHHGEIRRAQRLHAWHVRVAGDDLPRGRVDVEQDGALEAVVLGQDPRELGQSFFRAVLVIAREEDDVLSLPGACGAIKNQRRGVAKAGHKNRPTKSDHPPRGSPGVVSKGEDRCCHGG
jgi:hypothetical protein